MSNENGKNALTEAQTINLDPSTKYVLMILDPVTQQVGVTGNGLDLAESLVVAASGIGGLAMQLSAREKERPRIHRPSPFFSPR